MKINENRMSALIGDFYKINNNDNNKILQCRKDSNTKTESDIR